jgi:hypothetical protein
LTRTGEHFHPENLETLHLLLQLRDLEKRYPGVDRVVCATLGTPLEVQLEDLDRFAKELMPAFHPAKIAAAAE